MPIHPRRAPGNCPGCLGNRQCWICLGEGRQERPDHKFELCLRCHGTGRCAQCTPVADIDLTAQPHRPDRTIVLESPHEHLPWARSRP